MAAWATSLIEVLESQRSLLDELAPLAEQQGELIREGRGDALLDLLSRRQSVIDRFLVEAERLTAEVGDVTGRLDELPDVSRARIRGLIGDIDERLAHVLALDEQGQRSLRSARDETRRELATVDTGRSARQAYLPQAHGNRYTDHRG